MEKEELIESLEKKGRKIEFLQERLEKQTKEGEEITKEGEEITKEGEEITKEGEEITKEGEERSKEEEEREEERSKEEEEREEERLKEEEERLKEEEALKERMKVSEELTLNFKKKLMNSYEEENETDYEESEEASIEMWTRGALNHRLMARDMEETSSEESNHTPQEDFPNNPAEETEMTHHQNIVADASLGVGVNNGTVNHENERNIYSRLYNITQMLVPLFLVYIFGGLVLFLMIVDLTFMSIFKVSKESYWYNLLGISIVHVFGIFCLISLFFASYRLWGCIILWKIVAYICSKLG